MHDAYHSYCDDCLTALCVLLWLKVQQIEVYLNVHPFMRRTGGGSASSSSAKTPPSTM
jgi:hypothetical protein